MPAGWRAGTQIRQLTGQPVDDADWLTRCPLTSASICVQRPARQRRLPVCAVARTQTGGRPLPTLTYARRRSPFPIRHRGRSPPGRARLYARVRRAVYCVGYLRFLSFLPLAWATRSRAS
jgi:hypothetical protein